MRIVTLVLALAGGGLSVWLLTSHAAEPDSKAPVRKAYGIDKRTPWTTSNVKGSPEPPAPYRTEIAFPKLPTFFEPLEMAVAPGLDRIFIAERKGKIFSFANTADADQKELFLDVGKTVYGLAFHPQFVKNGYVYVTYVVEEEKPPPHGSRVVRYKANPEQPLRCDKSTEEVLLEWPSGGHNGGCLRFGQDGYLYIVTGDGSGIADEWQSGQYLGDLFASLLRIDVDHEDVGKAYAIPKDNPFIKTKGARPEVYAYGLRQAWKYSFDRQTGDLWAGEVGQDLWEMVYRIEKGGNYGWSVMEGTHPFRPDRKKGPTPILPPVIEQPHSLFRSITGGYVYRGKRSPELAGYYIYGDYDTGKIWAFRYQGGKATDHHELVDTALRVVAFGEDNAGEVYIIDYMGGKLHRLVKAPPATTASNFPRKLSETGLFASTKDHQVAPGLIPYSVNAQLWSDGASKERFLALPGESKIEFETKEYPQPAPGAPKGWGFPDGTVIVKTFHMEMEKGNPASKRRLETRLLHFEKLDGTEEVGDQYWKGYTYVWNDAQTDAELLADAGLDRELTIKDKDAPGGERKQTWHFPSRTECTLCHTMPAKFALGVNTREMNRDHDYGGVIANQLATLDHLGIFTKPLPEKADKLPRLYDYNDASVDLEKRARSYLHANCAHCHMKWGGGNAEFQLLATLPLKDLGVVNTRPGQGDFNIADSKILVPGRPDKSLIYYRMNKLGLGRMPHVASTMIDPVGVKLIHDWIQQLPAETK